MAHGETCLRPDSYLGGRPNFRRGFGGEYHRTCEAYIRVPAKSLYCPEQAITNTSSSGTFLQNNNSNSTVETRATNVRQTGYYKCRLSGIVFPASVHGDTVCETLQHLQPHPLTAEQRAPLRVVWRPKSSHEVHVDRALHEFVQQLERTQKNLSLLQSLQPSNSTSFDKISPLELRLRQTLDLVTPDMNQLKDTMEVIHDSGDADVDTCSYSSMMASEQLVDQSDTFLFHAAKIKPYSMNPSIADDDHMVEGSVSYNGTCKTDSPEQSTAVDKISLLRQLSRCVTQRMAYKQKLLASANEQLARCSYEEKTLRDELAGYTSSTSNNENSNEGTLGSAGLSLLPSNVLIRLDRWRSNTAAVIQLLCQLARRIASVDVKIAGFTKHLTENQTLASSQESELATLMEQKEALETQIMEAKELRSGLDECRCRLLESIPPWLMEKDVNGFDASTIGDQSVISDDLSRKKPQSVRDKVALQLVQSLKLLIATQVLETEIKEDGDLSHRLRDQSLLEGDLT